MIRSNMKIPLRLWLLIFFLLCVTVSGAKKIDPYKVLGVEKNASQREIQKAFHKLSLQYHPDKNKNKGAQEKFSEINNAYEILADEEKRKNYDLYGDEKGNPGFDSGHHNGDAGYSYFTNGGPGGNSFSFRPGDWQSSGGGQGGSQSYKFSFGGQQNPFDFFGMNDMFGDLFQGGSQSGGPKGSSGGFRTSAGPNPGSKTPTKSSIKTVSSKVFKKEISDHGMTWLLMSYTPMMKDHKYYESLAEEVSKSLDGVLKVGSINCENEASLCEELRVYPRRAPRLFIYKPRDSMVVEYHGDLIAKDLKVFCQEHLPRFSKRVDHLKTLEAAPTSGNDLPSVLLLSTQRDTPVIWRALSGLYHKRINFYDALVSDANDPKLKNFGVKSVPAIVGWLKNGERHILKSGISVKDKKSAIQELGKLLDDFERRNKKVANDRKPDEDSARRQQIPVLTASNIDSVCGEDVPVCIIGAFKSSRERDNIESVLSKVSQKSYSRKHTLSYALLDANKEAAFLKAFDAKSDKKLIAYKPRKGKFAAYANGVINEEGVESFISSVLNGDVQFSKTKQKPKLLS